ncbi:hypothetical protein D1871_08270 [Nakamurella silvestris]|nr:hypothetical protein D1871_08270 [Nakamurella silvestris]
MTTTALVLILSVPFVLALIGWTVRTAKHGGYNSGRSLRPVESDWSSGGLPTRDYRVGPTSALR